jgi:hypothetical protein
MNLTRERARQVEAKGLKLLKARGGRFLAELAVGIEGRRASPLGEMQTGQGGAGYGEADPEAEPTVERRFNERKSSHHRYADRVWEAYMKASARYPEFEETSGVHVVVEDESGALRVG